MKNKDIIYVDVDDEITGIIDKVGSAKEKIVALVLPKRASVFQSVVNMKLLKRAAEQKNKNIVLVTSEAGLLPLAGSVGLHVAKTLQSTPEIPPTPDLNNIPVDIDEEADVEEEPKINPTKPIGQLAGLPPLPLPAAAAGVDDAIEVDNDEDKDEDKPTSSKKEKKNKNKEPKKQKIKVPNFERFRVLLIVGVLVLILLIVGVVLAFKILPKATITIKTNTSTIGSDLSLTLNSTATSLDTTNLIVPAKMQQIQKTQTSPQVATTGEKTVGTAASGTLTVTNDCQNSSDVTIPAGTAFTDPSGNNFSSTSDVTVPGAQTTVVKGKVSCSSPTANVPVTADAVGAGYNDSSSVTFTSSDSDLSGYNIAGTTSGGNSNQEQSVAQADINKAQSDLSTPSSSSVEKTLEQDLQEAGYYPIPATFVAGTPSDSPSAVVDSQANSVTVTQSITYTMYGANQSQLNTLIENNVNQQINSSTQDILDTGLSSANFTLLGSTATTASLTMDAGSTVGPKINVATVKTNSEGKKSGDIQSMISSTPGVTSVNVKFGPFWVSSAPHNVNKINVVIEKSNGSSP
jgi:hypothetical protein